MKNGMLFLVNLYTKNAFFDSKEFKDISYVKDYLGRADTNKEINREIEQVSHMIEQYSELRGIAEKEAGLTEYSEVLRRNGPLPISEMGLLECFLEGEKEAPLTIIAQIAKDHSSLIKNIGESMRRVLRRERQKVNMGKAQQMDANCLIWLSKQPGYTTAQKAGSKQRVMAIVRQESFNTLENRVFKDFLKLCKVEALSYVRQYEQKFKTSERVKDVKELFSLVSSLLRIPEMDGVSDLKTNPQPNYVLQKNVNYSTMWKLYQKLRRKFHMIEEVWPYRHYLFREYFALLADISLLYHSNLRKMISCRYWINESFDKKQKGFLKESCSINYYSNLNKTTTLIPLFFSSKAPQEHISFRVKEENIYALGNRKFDFGFYYLSGDSDAVNLAEADYAFIFKANPSIKVLNIKNSKSIVLDSTMNIEEVFIEKFTAWCNEVTK